MRREISFDIDLLTVHDVAELLCISRRTVWRWCDRGLLPSPVRLGARCTRWRVSDVQRYLDVLAGERRRGTGQENE